MLEALIWGIIRRESSCDRIEANIVAGFAFAFGVFQKYYHANEAFEDSNMVAVIGTCATVSIQRACRSQIYSTDLT